jgi:hypothetical protein
MAATTTSTPEAVTSPAGEEGEHLTTGWEPEVPVEDTLLRRYLFHNADLTGAIALAAGGEVLERDDVVVADLRRPSGYWNAATLLAPPQDVDATLDAIEAFVAGGRGQVALWSAWPLPDLRRRGWWLSGHPPLLVRPPTSVLPPAEPAGATGAAVRVRDAGALARWERTVVEAYPMPELADEPPGAVAPAALLDDDRFGFWAAPDLQDPTAAAMAFRAWGLDSFALGASRAEHRHEGRWQRLCHERLRWSEHAWIAGVFSDHSRRGAERLGFVPLTRLTLWLLDRP